MVTRRALPLVLLVALAGCLSTPPSGAIACQNDCPIAGFYCATDGYCWQNGEHPTSTSAAATSSASGTAGSTGTNGGTGNGSGTAGSSGTTGKSTSSTGSSTGP